ncbi:MAG: sulfur carrier protein ThiS [bacterium]
MQLTINGETSEWPVDTTLPALFACLGLQGQRVAVAVNGNVVPRAGHALFVIHAGDQIEILTLAGGG